MDINNVNKFLNLDSAKLNYISKLDNFGKKNNTIYIQDNFEQKDLHILQRGHLDKKPILILINSGNEDEDEDENENNIQKSIDEKEIIEKDTIIESQYKILSTDNKNLYERTDHSHDIGNYQYETVYKKKSSIEKEKEKNIENILKNDIIDPDQYGKLPDNYKELYGETDEARPDGPNQVVYLYKKKELIEKEKEENIKKILAKPEITKDEYNTIPKEKKKLYDEINKQERGKYNETDDVTVYKLKYGGNTKKRKQKKAKRRRSSKKRNRT